MNESEFGPDAGAFDLAALEEGQEPLDPQPLPLPGFPQPLLAPMPAEDAPPDEPAAERRTRDDRQLALEIEPPSIDPAMEAAAAPEADGTWAAPDGDGHKANAGPAGAPDRETPASGTPASPAAAAAAAAVPAAPPTAAPARTTGTVAREPAPVEALAGLTSGQVRERTGRGLTNAEAREERSNWDIVRANTLTFFNMVLGSLIAALFVLAAVEWEIDFFQDGIFVGIVVAANVAIGTQQEIRATNTLRRIVALARPRARVMRDGVEQEVLAEEVVQDDVLLLGPGDQVVADGHVIADACEVDESLLTGESSSVRKEVGDEVLSGSFCAAGQAYYRAERVGAAAYAMQLSAEARRLVRRETPLQLRFRRILRMLLLSVAVLGALLLISSGVDNDDFGETLTNTTATITSIVPEGLLLGLTVAFAAGAVRVSRAGAIVQEINAVEALNYVDVVCLDKTGTITANALTVDRVQWAPGGEEAQGWLGAFARLSAADSRTAGAVDEALGAGSNGATAVDRVPFSSARRWSAMTLEAGGQRRHFVLGAPETVLRHCRGADALSQQYEQAASQGLRGIVFAEAPALPDAEAGIAATLQPLALITVADVLRAEVTAAFDTMRELGVEPKIISGDNPGTVAALVQQLGIDLKGGVISGAELQASDAAEFGQAVEENSIFGRIAPEQKQQIVSALKARGHYVAMVGDGANDVRALREADVAVAMESGTGTARAVSGIILRDDSFEAFVRGTAIAQSVLGNSSQLTKLFITKSFYAYLIIIASEMLGLEFPFLPRHGSLTALFTLGIPTIFITLTTPPPHAGRDFTNSVLGFAVPASLALAAAAVTVHTLTEGFLDRPIEDSQTLVSLTIGIVGLFYMVQVIGFEGVEAWHLTLRAILTTTFGALLGAVFILVLYVEPLREFFDFTEPGVDEWAIVIPAVIFAVAARYVVSRHWREIMAWIMRDPGGRDVLRGRQAAA